MTRECMGIVYEATPHQLRVLQSRKRFVFLGAGVGAGKTDVGSLWTLQRAKRTPPRVLGLIAANTYAQLIDSTLRNLYKNLRRFGWPHEPREIPTTHRPFNLRIWNGEHWTEWLCRSLENYDSLAGIEIGSFWLDEVWATKQAAIEQVVARLRDTRMPDLQGLFTTTLDDPTTWMYRMFVERYDAAIMDVIYAPTRANKRNLPAGYIEALRSMYSDRLFDRMVEALWVTLSGVAIYSSFNRQEHVSDVAEFDPALPILWTHDFNIGEGKPMSSALCQLKKGPGLDGKLRPELHVFDEIVIDSSDTNDAITEFEGRKWKGLAKAGVLIYGDAAGKAKDTRSKQTDYGLLAAAGYGRQKVPASNPPLRTRHNTVNGLLKNKAGDIRVRIHSRCTTLARGFETVKLKKGAEYLEQETREQHVTTAFGYLCCEEFPQTPRAGAIQSMPW